MGHRAPLISALVDSFNPNSAAGHFQNGAWRIDYWAYLSRKTLHNPVFGAGFGRPANFHWDGNVYDSRNGVDVESVSPPHNSFMNLLYRTGLLGFAALLVLLWIAVRTFLRQLRATRTPDLVALLALFAFICVVAFLNVALEGPYMAMFFWTVVGLMLTLPVLLGGEEPRRFSLPRVPRRAASED
jgi:O-antigen ligase